MDTHPRGRVTSRTDLVWAEKEYRPIPGAASLTAPWQNRPTCFAFSPVLFRRYCLAGVASRRYTVMILARRVVDGRRSARLTPSLPCALALLSLLTLDPSLARCLWSQAAECGRRRGRAGAAGGSAVRTRRRLWCVPGRAGWEGPSFPLCSLLSLLVWHRVVESSHPLSPLSRSLHPSRLPFT